MMMRRRFAFVLVVLTLALALLVSCGPKATPTPVAEAEELSGKKVVMIIASRDFRDEELSVPRSYLEGKGATVIVASSSLDPAKGMLGSQVKPQMLISDIKVDEYDAIVFVGGVGAEEYWDNPTAHTLAREAVEKGKILAAICIAPVTLARAGVLKGKKATVFPKVSAELEAAGASYTGRTVERDGNIITANGPKAAEEFAREIARALAGR